MTTEQVSELLAQFLKVGLALNPTPLHPMQRLQQDLGCGPLFIKRDDLNGLGVGGNKIRNFGVSAGRCAGTGQENHFGVRSDPVEPLFAVCGCLLSSGTALCAGTQ